MVLPFSPSNYRRIYTALRRRDLLRNEEDAPNGTICAVDLLDDDVLVEASGGIELDDVPAYAATGVDVISMGSLTHSAEQLDVSVRV